jgi:hypothetical protein
MTSKQSSPTEELADAVKALQKIAHKMAVAAYEFERSFVENVKEISGTGWTAEEAKKRYGL